MGKRRALRVIIEGKNLVLDEVSKISKCLDLRPEVMAGSLASGPDSMVGIQHLAN